LVLKKYGKGEYLKEQW